MVGTLAIIHVNDLDSCEIPGWYQVYTSRGIDFVSPGQVVAITSDNGYNRLLGKVLFTNKPGTPGYYRVYVTKHKPRWEV